MKKTKRILGVLLLAALTILSSQLTFAEYRNGAKLPKSFTMRVGDQFEFKVKGIARSLKSTKKSVARASKTCVSNTILLTALKPGKTKITVKYGKKKATCKVTVKKYENPFEKLIIMGKDVRSSFDTIHTDDTNNSMTVAYGSKGLFSFKLKSKYTIKKVYHYYNRNNFQNNSIITANDTLFDSEESVGLAFLIYDKTTKTSKEFYYWLINGDYEKTEDFEDYSDN